jgi:hypothetical protein
MGYGIQLMTLDDPLYAYNALLKALPEGLEQKMSVNYGRLRMALDKRDAETARQVAVDILDYVETEMGLKEAEELLIVMRTSKSARFKFLSTFYLVMKMTSGLLAVLLMFKEVVLN